MTPCFLNVDLDITSRSKLDSLAAAMGNAVIVLYSGPVQGRHLLVLESSREHIGPDATIRALCTVVEKLPSDARSDWYAAHKEFNVGYELRASELFSQFRLRPDTLHRVANLGATLAVTYYRSDDAEPDAAPKRRPASPRATRVRRKGGDR